MLFRDRPEWADVVPIKQDESPRSVVRIAYSEEFMDAHDYVRAVMAADERSERVLALTAEALQMNVANYTIWAYRRNVLLSLKSSLSNEHHFTKTLLYDNPKNYQLWYHLQWMVEQGAIADGDPKTVYSRQESALFAQLRADLHIILQILLEDSKNYHAWQYRRWLADFFVIPAEDELKFCVSMLSTDGLNNSAWNHRFYTVSLGGFTDEVFETEVNFAIDHLKEMPNNECVCNYLLGIVSPVLSRSEGFSVKYDRSTTLRLLKVRELIEDIINQDIRGAADTPAILSLLVDLLTLTLESRISNRQNTPDSAVAGDLEKTTDLAQRTVEICDRLASEVDRVRTNYWQYRKSQVQALQAQITAPATS